MRLLVTRPSEDAGPLAERLAAAGHESHLQPLMTIAPIDGPPLTLDGIGGVLVTSGNGVRALAARSARRDLPVFAVGAHTASLAERAGFETVVSAEGDVETLVEMVARHWHPADGTLLHAAGETTVGDLAGRLKARGHRVEVATLYRAAPVAALAPEIDAALAAGAFDGVLLFSPRTAAIWRRLVLAGPGPDAARRLDAWCLSGAVAAAIEDLPHRSVHRAQHPTSESLLSALAAPPSR